MCDSFILSTLKILETFIRCDHFFDNINEIKKPIENKPNFFKSIFKR